jgi:hypothetical protein
MNFIYDEEKNCLISDTGIETDYYALPSGSFIYYKDIIVKVSGRGRPRNAELFHELMGKLFAEKISKQKKPKKVKNKFEDHPLVKNGYAEVVLVNGIYGFKLKKSVIRRYVKMYRNWANLNEDRKACSRTGRITNLPEEISEGLCCLHLNKVLFHKKRDNKHNIKITFDCLDENNTHQVKGACSSGPSSFSPKDSYDSVLFFNFDPETTKYDIYSIDKVDIDAVKVNSNQSLKDQREEGRRPRTSLIKLAKDLNLTPIYTGYLIQLENNVNNEVENNNLDIELVVTSEGVFNV